jgi:hypothetical protein
MPTGSCFCGNGCAAGCGCQCSNVPGIFDCTCEDPGVADFGAHLAIRDSQFCNRRLENEVGLLQNQVTGSGQYRQTWTNEPSVALSTFSVTAGAEFGNLIAINADGIWRQLDFPNVAGLVVQTNASGQLVASALPAATIPDPLTVTTLNATTGNFGALNATGAVALTGLGTGTISQAVGLDGSGNLIKATGGTSSGVSSAQFFESPSSNSTATPNDSATANGFLVIGNLISDSGGSIAQVQDSQTIKILVAGYYLIDWGAFMDTTVGLQGASILLTVNGSVVNNGYGYPLNIDGSTINRPYPVSGDDGRPLAANDVIKLQVSSGCVVRGIYQARLRLVKIG